MIPVAAYNRMFITEGIYFALGEISIVAVQDAGFRCFSAKEVPVFAMLDQTIKDNKEST